MFFCKGFGRAIGKVNDTEYYCFFVRVWEAQYKEELILKITVLFVRVWEEQCREELILNITVFDVRVWWSRI
jgi:hypothetical protein